jgi:transcriptional regulator with XRE-family HTH domain
MANQIDKFVGDRIAARREFLGISIIEAARAVAVEVFEFKRYEAGTVRIDARRLQKLCALFDVSSQYFFCLPDAEPRHGDTAQAKAKRRASATPSKLRER